MQEVGESIQMLGRLPQEGLNGRKQRGIVRIGLNLCQPARPQKIALEGLQPIGNLRHVLEAKDKDIAPNAIQPNEYCHSAGTAQEFGFRF
jgi:hypothetical protein